MTKNGLIANNDLIHNIAAIIHQARNQVRQTVNQAMVPKLLGNWTLIGGR